MILDFESWYKGWQDKMRADPILEWAKNARNKIEKVGDLATKSILRVSHHHGWLAESHQDALLCPMLTASEISEAIRAGIANSDADEHELIKVERRWIDVELPDSEIVDALAHCFRQISQLLAEAHARISDSSAHLECDSHRTAIDVVESKKPNRVQWVIPSQHSIVTSGRRLLDSSKEDLEYAAKKYGIGEQECRWADENATFQDRCVSLLETAQGVLKIDGYHSPMAFMFGPGGFQYRVLEFFDRGEKYMILRELAQEALRYGINCVMLVNEAWTSRVHPNQKRIYAAVYDPNRGESLCVNGLTSRGDVVNCSSEFSRIGGAIVFEPHHLNSTFANILAPFARIWNLEKLFQARGNGGVGPESTDL